MTGLLENPDNPIARIIAESDNAATREEMEKAQEQLREMLSEGFKEAEISERPFSPSIEMTSEFSEAYIPQPEGGVEAGVGRFVGGMAVDAANALSAAERRVAFRLKTLFGFNGLRLVEEGDSWTQYPILLKDIVDQLDENRDIAIFSLGAAGDLVADMAGKKEYLRAIKKAKADAMLLSGGGNDLFGDLKAVLLDYSENATPEELINEGLFSPLFDAVMASYETILSDVEANHPGLVVFGHGYDLPYPLDDGKWIGPALA